MAVVRDPDERPKYRRPAATTLEARENQLIAAAVTLAEKQIQEGTASAQVITHYLKMGTTRERLEQEKLRRENELLKSRADAIASGKKVEALFTEAINAFKSYSGNDSDQPDED